MPTDEQRALWAAIRAHPDEDTPRLVYADWLQEHGDEARAEFVRVQVELAKLGPDRRKGRKQRPVLEAREKELLASHQHEWSAPLETVIEQSRGVSLGMSPWHISSFKFRRGFAVASLRLEATRLLALAENIEPVELHRLDVGRSEHRPASIAALAQWEGSNMIREFLLDGAANEDVTVITGGGHFRNLLCLGLNGFISDSGVRELARWPWAIKLHTLDLKANPITHTSAFVLADSPYLDNLEHLDLSHTRINDDGRQRLRERFRHKVRLSSEIL